MVVVTLRRRIEVVEARIWFHPIQQSIDHQIAFIQIDAFVLQIPAQNLETHRVFARQQPVQIQAAPFPSNARFIALTTLHLPAQIRRARPDNWIQRNFRARACHRFRFQNPVRVSRKREARIDLHGPGNDHRAQQKKRPER